MGFDGVGTFNGDSDTFQTGANLDHLTSSFTSILMGEVSHSALTGVCCSELMDDAEGGYMC